MHLKIHIFMTNKYFLFILSREFLFEFSLKFLEFWKDIFVVINNGLIRSTCNFSH